ncbi:hypothetical protein SETIT_9G427900v2 [Setaria italica]|uniref:Uncharacterized protein n=1 Tax=Setaria italica TaxID=4555 RepID=K4AKD9_SETIT|nr:hypothetical protein SETIT_9G427900v2 [Setaria italica]
MRVGPHRCHPRSLALNAASIAAVSYLKNLPEPLHRIVHGGAIHRTPGKKARGAPRRRGRGSCGSRKPRASAPRRSTSQLAWSATGASRRRPQRRGGPVEWRPQRGRDRGIRKAALVPLRRALKLPIEVFISAPELCISEET